MASVKFREGDVVKHKSTMFDGEWRVDYVIEDRGDPKLRVGSTKHEKAKHIFDVSNCILLRRPLRAGDVLVHRNVPSRCWMLSENDLRGGVMWARSGCGWSHEGGIEIDITETETDEQLKQRMREILPMTAFHGEEKEEPYCDHCGNSGKDLLSPVEICRTCFDVEKTANGPLMDEVRRLRDTLVPLKDELERMKREKIDLEATLYRKDREIEKLKRGK